MHRQRLSRSQLRGGRIHRMLGDGIISKALWSPTRGSLARAWLVGFPITIVPFLPGQSVLAAIAALMVRGNLLLCIALQFLSNPVTAVIQLPACYFVGEVARGISPREVWPHAWNMATTIWQNVWTMELRWNEEYAHAFKSLYLGAIIIGIVGGVLGYAIILQTWKDKVRLKGVKSDESMPPFGPQ